MDEEVKPNEVDVCRSGDLNGHTKEACCIYCPNCVSLCDWIFCIIVFLGTS